MDARGWNRHIVEREVSCRIGGRGARAFLYNLSLGGCMLEVSGPAVAVGDPLTVELTESAHPTGEVVWKIDSWIGIRFADPVEESVAREAGLGAIGPDGARQSPSGG